MDKKDDLFAPPSDEEILMSSDQDDLFAPPSDDELMSVKKDDETEESSIFDLVPSEVKGTTTGALTGKVVEKSLSKTADYLPRAAEKMAARSIGLYDTAEGRKFLRNQMSQLGLPEGSINPQKIGRLALDEGLLGKVGLKSAADQLDQVDESMRSSILQKQKLLDEIKATRELSQINKKTENIIGPLDLDLDPDAPKLEKLIMKEYEKSFDEDGNFRPKYKTAKELEDAKVKLQDRQKYQATRSESASDKFEKSRARALRETVDEMAEEAGIGDKFTNTKADIGSRGVMRDVISSKTLNDLKSKNIDASTTSALAFGRPDIPILRQIYKGGKGIAAKTMDAAGKILNTKPVRVLTKNLPMIGALAGFEAARAEGLSKGQAAGRVALEEATDLAMGPASLLYGGETGPKIKTIEGKLERGTRPSPEEYKILADKQNEIFEEYFVKDPKKVNMSVMADEMRSKIGEKANPIANQLDAIQREENSSRKKAKFHFVKQQPAYKKLKELLSKEYVKDMQSITEDIMSVDPELQKQELDDLGLFNERKKTLNFEGGQNDENTMDSNIDMLDESKKKSKYR